MTVDSESLRLRAERERRPVNDVFCPTCGSRATLYAGDLRARGWFRGECVNGHWWDQDTDRQPVLPQG